MEKLGENIDSAFFADVFLMMAMSDRREITAREIDERHEEKLLMLGPTLFRINEDVTDPLIDRTFNVMNRKGLIPPPPADLQGGDLQVEYISPFAQAQKQLEVVALERFAGFVGQMAQYDPSVLDRVDGDELIGQYAEATGIPPKIVRSMDLVEKLRAQRQQQQQMQQAAENAP